MSQVTSTRLGQLDTNVSDAGGARLTFPVDAAHVRQPASYGRNLVELRFRPRPYEER